MEYVCSVGRESNESGNEQGKSKQGIQEAWDDAASGWYRWSNAIAKWLDPATEVMFNLADIRTGQRVHDVAAGTGGQTILAARRVGPAGSVLATDVDAQVMDAENLELEADFFDVIICRLGLMLFPHQSKSLSF